MSRYIIYGVIPSEHEQGNPELDPESQQLSGATELYSTDDAKEAERIVKDGGFVHNEVWRAATWAKDTMTGKTIGNAPF